MYLKNVYQEITLSKAYFSESTLSPHLTPLPPPQKKEATNSRDIYAVGIEENYNFAGIQLHLSQMYSDTKTFTNLQTKRLFYYVIDPCHACVLIVASFLI